MAPPCLGPGPDPVLSPPKEPPRRQRSVREARVHLPEARCGEAGRRQQLSGRSSCYPGHPEARRVAGPEGQVAEGEPSGPEQAGLTLPTSPAPSLSRLPTAMPTDPGEGGHPDYEGEMRPGSACPPPGRRLTPAPHLTCPLA